jgi:hypothetical protein
VLVPAIQESENILTGGCFSLPASQITKRCPNAEFRHSIASEARRDQSSTAPADPA